MISNNKRQVILEDAQPPLKRRRDSSSTPFSSGNDISDSIILNQNSGSFELKSYRNPIERLKNDFKYRKLVHGSTNFLVCLGLTCNLTLNTISSALKLFHQKHINKMR